jgi:two-component system chemotaxis sensor kinase CheA
LKTEQEELYIRKVIKEKLEQLSEAVVFAEPSDLHTLGELHTKFQEIGTISDEILVTETKEAVKAAEKLIEKIILEEVSDANTSLEAIGRTVSALQEIIRDGKKIEDVDFPPELGLNGDAGDSSASASQSFSLPANVDEGIFIEFLSHQESDLQEVEKMILDLENADNGENLKALKRRIHTLKGESALMGLMDIERLCHKTEDFLNEVPADQAVDVLLIVKDWLVSAFRTFSDNGEEPCPVDDILKLLIINGEKPKSKPQKIKEEKVEEDQNISGKQPENVADLMQDNEVEKNTEPTQLKTASDETEELVPIELDMDLTADFISESHEHLETADLNLLILENDPQNEEAMNAVFRAFHTIKGVAGFLALKEIGSLAHESENLLDMARKGNLTLDSYVMDIIFESVDKIKRLIARLSDSIKIGKLPARDETLPALIEKIKAMISGDYESGAVSVSSTQPTEEPESVENIVEKKITESKDDEILEKKKQTPSAAQKTGMNIHQAVKIKETLKVDAERLDLLVDTIGELVISESMISQSEEIKNIASAALLKQINHLDKITRDLQDMGTSLRMIPIRSTFQKMARLVRDLSKKANKPIEFVMTGEDTELDKTVVDKIGDPLVHMMRNAVDHGIEDSPVDRLKVGKPEKGRVELRAFHSGGKIYIEVKDDGKGLDRDAILAKARKRGIIKNEDVLSDREVWGLIFEAGFSTAKKVTDVSGRGVGMDVVRKNIEALRGKVEIRSEKGKGSVFTIILPLTLAIIEGMVVRVGSEKYIIPTLSVITSLRPRPEDITTVVNRTEMLSFKDKLIPLFRLSRFFKIDKAEQDLTQAIVVVIESAEQQVGLLVDDLLGQHQVVIKSLSETFQGIEGISGGTIMPDGRVGLIIDVDGLVRLGNKEGAVVAS